MSNISVVINTWNSGETLTQCLESVKNLGEIIVVDMHSTDNTREIASSYTEHIYLHPYTGYVEPARNFAISKGTKEWILVLDSDEEVSPSLEAELTLISEQSQTQYTHYSLPRKNIIFGTWVKHAGWWPDNQLRFFRKHHVVWSNEIHSVPKTEGLGHTFPPEEQYALIHHHYTSVSQWIQRMDRYTTIQANELIAKGYTYQFRDNLSKPFSEFLRRFFAWEGYKDGVIGINLALLQALSEIVVYLKVKETQGVKELPHELFLKELKEFSKKSSTELSHWMIQSGIKSRIERMWERLSQ